MGNLTSHAEREMKLVGLYDKDSDYAGALPMAVLGLMDVFSKQNHSGASAARTLQLFTKLANFENLSPITSNPDEWTNVSEMSGITMWQSKRNPAIFSNDEGKTWYNIDDKK